ncbi:MAG: tryptophan synthase subunit alpha [Gemmatimonadota bacterium]
MTPPSIARTFAERNAKGQVTLIPYVTAGYPGRKETLPVMKALAKAGADILELGIPFSDPLADGPTIQRSSFAALQGGMTVRGILEDLRRFRETEATPVVLFSYLNPILRYGVEDFLRDAVEAGAQGLLLTDLPTGADPRLEDAIRASGLDLIRLLAPTTDAARIPAVAREGSGFLYYISRTGVTGARTSLREELAAEVAAVRERVDLPVAVGFGISSPEQAAEVGGIAEGVVVGSAVIQALDEGGTARAADFVASLRRALDR